MYICVYTHAPDLGGGGGWGSGLSPYSITGHSVVVGTAHPRGGTGDDLVVMVVSPVTWDAGTRSQIALRATERPTERH